MPTSWAPKGVDCEIPHRPTEMGDMPYMYMPTSYSTRPFGSSLALGSVGTPKLSVNEPEHSQDGLPIGKFCSREFPETKP